MNLSNFAILSAISTMGFLLLYRPFPTRKRYEEERYYYGVKSIYLARLIAIMGIVMCLTAIAVSIILKPWWKAILVFLTGYVFAGLLFFTLISRLSNLNKPTILLSIFSLGLLLLIDFDGSSNPIEFGISGILKWIIYSISILIGLIYLVSAILALRLAAMSDTEKSIDSATENILCLTVLTVSFMIVMHGFLSYYHLIWMIIVSSLFRRIVRLTLPRLLKHGVPGLGINLLIGIIAGGLTFLQITLIQSEDISFLITIKGFPIPVLAISAFITGIFSAVGLFYLITGMIYFPLRRLFDLSMKRY